VTGLPRRPDPHGLFVVALLFPLLLAIGWRVAEQRFVLQPVGAPVGVEGGPTFGLYESDSRPGEDRWQWHVLEAAETVDRRLSTWPGADASWQQRRVLHVVADALYPTDPGEPYLELVDDRWLVLRHGRPDGVFPTGDVLGLYDVEAGRAVHAPCHPAAQFERSPDEAEAWLREVNDEAQLLLRRLLRPPPGAPPGSCCGLVPAPGLEACSPVPEALVGPPTPETAPIDLWNPPLARPVQLVRDPDACGIDGLPIILPTAATDPSGAARVTVEVQPGALIGLDGGHTAADLHERLWSCVSWGGAWYRLPPGVQTAFDLEPAGGLVEVQVGHQRFLTRLDADWRLWIRMHPCAGPTLQSVTNSPLAAGTCRADPADCPDGTLDAQVFCMVEDGVEGELCVPRSELCVGVAAGIDVDAGDAPNAQVDGRACYEVVPRGGGHNGCQHRSLTVGGEDVILLIGPSERWLVDVDPQGRLGGEVVELPR